ncbi:hypothetical protein Tsubulata_009682 [Turnera subulata]|uniref:DUF3444 domain-containing protein n=1 Tax=Turnera subulata TaxID=218843 RepID=A0A9Q0GI38_9ROSI|nr:hypothetical protein Tsubulata_009682 [Turnera subulata]
MECNKDEAMRAKEISERKFLAKDIVGAKKFASKALTFSKVKTTKSASRAGHSSAPFSSSKSKPNTFWTVCHGCKMQYEYLRVYLNHKLLCPNCHEPFLAVETAPPPKNGTTAFSQQWPNSNHQSVSGRNKTFSPNVGPGGADSYNQNNFQWEPFTKTGGASSAAQAASVVQQAYEKVKREREEAQAATKRAESLKRFTESAARKNRVSKRMAGLSSSGYTNAKRMRGMDDVGPSNNGSHSMRQMGAGFGGGGSTNVSGSKQGKFETGRVNGITKPFSMRDVTSFDIQKLLMEKAKVEIGKKLNEWNSVKATKLTAEEGTRNLKAGSRTNSANRGMLDQNKSDKPVDIDNGAHALSSDSKKDENVEILSINVPDPDFHDFDKDRTEKCFGENQVWAAYDDDDGMPRYYAMIHNVISLNPFKMRISWLNSKTNSELGSLNWVGSGFSKTCGDFRVGKYEIYDSLNSFSHKVRWTKGVRGVIHIYPRKGDVWALYRNWSPEWNELTADEVIHKYDMVEVLEDYNEELGVTVTPLIKVAGFKTVFHQHLDPREVRRIPREEMFRFSHHVPSYLLTGQEGTNAPKGCRELDPAATPPELLQVIEDVKEEELVETEGKVVGVKEEELVGTEGKVVNVLEEELAGTEGKVVDDVKKVGDEGIGKINGENQVEEEERRPQVHLRCVGGAGFPT